MLRRLLCGLRGHNWLCDFPHLLKCVKCGAEDWS